MADVYKFRIELKNCSKKMYRDVEMSSLSSVAKLGYIVIAIFDGCASHLFCINYKGKRYEIDCGVYGKNIVLANPIKMRLQDLKMEVGNQMTMEYDFGSGWEFSIELLSIVEMKKGTGKHYPYSIEGQGKGIIEDMFPPQLDELIKEIDKTGIIPMVYSLKYEKEMKWDYRDFNLEYLNMTLKNDIDWIQDAYEHPILRQDNQLLN